MHIPTIYCGLKRFVSPDIQDVTTNKSSNTHTVVRHRLMPLTLVGMMVLSSVNAPAFAAIKQNLTLKEAISRTLSVHPDLKSYAFQSQATQGAITQAGVSSPMSLNAKIEDALGTGEFSNISAMKTTISIDWLLENEKINARIKLASNKAKLVEFEKQTKALDIAAKTAMFYITLLSQKEQLTLAKLALAQATKAYDEVEKKRKAGKSPVVDKYRAKANVANTALIVEDLTHEIETSQAKLAAQWQGEVDFIASDSLVNIPSVVAIEKTYGNLKQHPKFKQLDIENKITNSAVSLAKVNEKPAWQFSAGVKHDNFNDDFGLTAGISIPLGAENRNQGQIIKLQAQQNVKQAQTDAWQKHVFTQLLLVSHQLKHNRHVIDSLNNEVIPALESANSEAEKAYTLGLYRYSEWYDVQQELISVQFDLINAYANIHQLNIELQRLSGASFTL